MFVSKRIAACAVALGGFLNHEAFPIMSKGGGVRGVDGLKLKFKPNAKTDFMNRVLGHETFTGGNGGSLQDLEDAVSVPNYWLEQVMADAERSVEYERKMRLAALQQRYLQKH